ncbi:MAG: outer membrane beta-barrel protein [Pelagimonas sp.]|jgi:opacity protein-like surface antigen|nr:outer membrane beta-barrel protein [Pelagimonas sp.]
MLKWTVAALALTVAAPVAAQDFYGQVYGGFDRLQDSTFSGTIGGANRTVDTGFDDGYSAGVSIGRYFSGLSNDTYALRGEVELSFSRNEANTVDFSGNGVGNEGNVGGDIRSTRLFANVLADFKTQSRLTPYVGAGLGVDFVDHGISYGRNVTITGQDEALAAQLIVGGAYEVSDGVSLFSDVRFLRSFDVESTRTAPNGTTARVSDDLSRANVNFGLRFQF